MNPQSEIYGKPSGRAFSDEAAGYVVPFSALDLPFSFDTMEKQPTIENLEGEIWKPVLGFEGLYEVSNMGRVKSLNYNHTKQERLIKPRLTNGYYQILLQKEKIQKQPVLQRVVYEAFHGKLPQWVSTAKGDERMEINHIDENPLNNRLDNLELVTMKYNNNYGTRIKRIMQHQCRKVYQYTLDFSLVKIWNSTKDCGRNGFCQSCVASCCRHEYRTIKTNEYKGYIWSYVPLKIETK